MIFPVTLERVGTNARGDLWRVTHDGIVIVESSRVPEYDAARALAALGLAGTIETRHAGSAIVSMRLDISKAATLTVIENDRSGPRLGLWQPFDRTQRHRIAIPETASGQASRNRPSPFPA